ncbi:MAG: hypothetical protein AYK19_01680 [Theionarchaea archaeon DG-70-1]|nr:MAG: hypothetical protein AYK19_01680 [Theionarchaea archaeon DG-70-1]
MYLCIEFMTKHTTMSIPKALYDSVKEIIDSVPELGYTTPAEFCKDAIRRRISDIKKECQIRNVRSVNRMLSISFPKLRSQ